MPSYFVLGATFALALAGFGICRLWSGGTGLFA